MGPPCCNKEIAAAVTTIDNFGKITVQKCGYSSRTKESHLLLAATTAKVRKWAAYMQPI
jgi:hypothetical protein